MQASLLAGSLLLASGCKTTAPNTSEGPAGAAPSNTATVRTDQQIATDIQSRISGESALAGQNIQVSVNGGTATLNGSVSNDASRALAGVDSGSVSGVHTVINNLTVGAPQIAQSNPSAQLERRYHEPAPPPRREERRHNQEMASNQQDTSSRPPQNVPAPPQEPVRTVPPAPVTPPPPVSRTVSVGSGTSLPVRLTEGLDSATAQQGQAIHGTLAADVIVDDMIAIPRGTPVTGQVVEARDATHFSGNSLISIGLTQIDLKGRPLPVTTAAYSQEGKGRGKNTAEKAGGGAALGAIIGAIAGGGKGAAIGAASGGGLGAGVNAVTRGQQVKIPAETLINFKLQSPVSVTTSRSANGESTRTFNDTDNSQPQQQ
jgi:hypothetical protein